jgi:amidohydrolase
MRSRWRTAGCPVTAPSWWRCAGTCTPTRAGYEEHRTTALLVERLSNAGLAPKVLRRAPAWSATSVAAPGPVVVLRADIDALPLQDEKLVPYRSTVDGLCHACGHDVHTTSVLAPGSRWPRWPTADRHVRLVFQPAEEQMPGGALDVIADGWLDGAASGLRDALRPALEVGRVGSRPGRSPPLPTRSRSC